jgi:hypothetical protein
LFGFGENHPEGAGFAVELDTYWSFTAGAFILRQSVGPRFTFYLKFGIAILSAFYQISGAEF